MTRSEFISKIELWHKRQTRHQGVFFSAVAVLFGTWIILFNRYDHTEPSSPGRIAWVAIPLSLFIVMIVGQKLTIRYTFNRYGVSCPKCGKPLGGIQSVVIATGNCGNCGERILDDTPATPLL